jgi:hypothetical protein
VREVGKYGGPVPRELLVVALVAVAAGIAALVKRRTAEPVPARTGATVPGQLARADFARPGAEWLVVLFSSDTCLSCAGTWDKVELLESDAVATERVSFQEHRDRHERYGIDSVPLVLVADAEGVVRSTFLGPPSAADLWASLAELRSAGSVPEGCDHHASAPDTG